MSLETTACVTDPARAGLLLHPLRPRILELAREEALSASEMAARLEEPRQKVNYHVRQLAQGGFLEPAGTRPKGNMTEKLFRASARAWVLAPEVLGAVGADPSEVRDAASAGYLLALAGRIQSDLARLGARAAAEGKRLATLSLDAEIRFESPEQRRDFTRALEAAVTELVARHTSPARTPEGEPASGRPYRLVLGCYPSPPEDEDEPVPTSKRKSR